MRGGNDMGRKEPTPRPKGLKKPLPPPAPPEHEKAWKALCESVIPLITIFDRVEGETARAILATDKEREELRTRIVELEGVIKWIEDEGVTVQVMKNISEENARLREAVEYMADPDNWIEEDGWLKMKRPGGGKQDGIMLVSREG
jgi:hypothetical protein